MKEFLSVIFVIILCSIVVYAASVANAAETTCVGVRIQKDAWDEMPSGGQGLVRQHADEECKKKKREGCKECVAVEVYE